MDEPKQSDKIQETSNKTEPVVDETAADAQVLAEEPKAAAPTPAAVKKLDAFKVGDLVKVTIRDPKENKVHATPFEGVVISFRGQGDNKTFTVRRIGAMKVAIERIFPINSPSIENIRVIKSSPASRAKLYYLRKKKN